MTRVIAIDTNNTFAHLYLDVSTAKADPNLPMAMTLNYFFESGVPLAEPATFPTPQHLAELQKRLVKVKDELLRWIAANPTKLNGIKVKDAKALVNTYVRNGNVSVELFRAYATLRDDNRNFIHNWLHH